MNSIGEGYWWPQNQSIIEMEYPDNWYFKNSIGRRTSMKNKLLEYFLSIYNFLPNFQQVFPLEFVWWSDIQLNVDKDVMELKRIVDRTEVQYYWNKKFWPLISLDFILTGPWNEMKMKALEMYVLVTLWESSSGSG